MRVLQARFHPRQTALQEFVIVGHVVWTHNVALGEPTIEPSTSSVDSSGVLGTMVAKLKYLVAIAGPEPFERLQGLRSRFWSFVEVGHAREEDG